MVIWLVLMICMVVFGYSLVIMIYMFAKSIVSFTSQHSCYKHLGAPMETLKISGFHPFYCVIR